MKLGRLLDGTKKKFFIKPENVTRVKLEICPQIPIFRAGSKQGVARLLNQESQMADIEGDSDSSSWTCVYFDNLKLRLYHDKITQKEGSTVLKAKWPGTSYNQMCSIERKRTAYVLDEHSIKDKIELPFSKVDEFLNGNLRLKEINRNNLFVSDANVKAAHGALYKLVEKLKLKPSIQSQFSRVVFHNPNQTGIHIYLDYDIVLCKEEIAQTWCTKIGGDTPVVLFPMAVLSIKIQNGTTVPNWLNALMQSEYLIQSYKFGKFIHATSKFNASKCKVLPGWFSNPLSHRDGHSLRHWYLTNMDVNANIQPAIPFVDDSALDPIRRAVSRPEVEAYEDLPSSDSSDEEGSHVTSQLLDNNKKDSDKGKEPLRPSHNRSPPKERGSPMVRDNSIVQLRESAVKSTGRVSEVHTIANNNKPPPVWSEPQNDTNKKGGLLGFFRRRKLFQQAREAGMTPLVTPIRLEPKTHFANERTLLQWINVSLFLSIGSFAFFQLIGDVPQAVGVGILVLSLLFIIYALLVFHYRRRAIVSRNIDGHYDDKFGPTVMVIILFIYLIASLVFQISYVPPVPVLTATRAVRDYRIPLAPSLLLAPDLFPTGINNLKSDIASRLGAFPLRGNFDSAGVQNVTWFDSRSSCLLRRNGFRLRQIAGPDYSGAETTNCALEFRTEDWEYINQLDNTYITTFFNATEIIGVNNTFQYSREIYKGYYQNPDLPNFQNLATKFDSFFLWDYIPSASWTEPLEAVNPSALSVFYYGDIRTNLRNNGSPSKIATFGLYIWYIPENWVPVWGELSFSFPVAAGQDLTKQEIIDAKFIFDQLKFVNGLDSSTTRDVTDVVYAFQPNFCI